MKKMKTCSKCRCEKKRDEFYKDKRNNNGLQSQCIECMRGHLRKYYQENKESFAEHNRKYRQENQEIIVEGKRRYYQENKDFVAESTRKYYQENKEYYAEYNRKYQQDNKEAIAEYKRKYQQENKEHIAEYQRNYYQENKEAKAEYDHEYRQTPTGKEVARVSNAKRKAIKSNLEGHYTAEQFTELCELADNKCLCCGKKVKLTADHIIPITWEDSNNYIWNIQPLCKSCNSSKGNHHDTDYRTEGMILWAGGRMNENRFS